MRLERKHFQSSQVLQALADAKQDGPALEHGAVLLQVLKEGDGLKYLGLYIAPDILPPDILEPPIILPLIFIMASFFSAADIRA